MSEFLLAVGTGIALVMVIEGLLYAIFPDGMRRMMAQMAYVPPEMLRRAGLVAAIIGTVIVWLLRG